MRVERRKSERRGEKGERKETKANKRNENDWRDSGFQEARASSVLAAAWLLLSQLI